jgi:hypothetical protein
VRCKHVKDAPEHKDCRPLWQLRYHKLLPIVRELLASSSFDLIHRQADLTRKDMPYHILLKLKAKFKALTHIIHFLAGFTSLGSKFTERRADFV